MVDRSDLEARLAAVKRAYVDDLPARAAGLRAAWAQVQAGTSSRGALEELHRLAHNLAGSGATFGFTELSARARAFEIPLKALLQDANADRSALPELFDAMMAALAAAAEADV